jgi:hypothetical protein
VRTSATHIALSIQQPPPGPDKFCALQPPAIPTPALRTCGLTPDPSGMGLRRQNIAKKIITIGCKSERLVSVQTKASAFRDVAE